MKVLTNLAAKSFEYVARNLPNHYKVVEAISEKSDIVLAGNLAKIMYLFHVSGIKPEHKTNTTIELLTTNKKKTRKQLPTINNITYSIEEVSSLPSSNIFNNGKLNISVVDIDFLEIENYNANIFKTSSIRKKPQQNEVEIKFNPLLIVTANIVVKTKNGNKTISLTSEQKSDWKNGKELKDVLQLNKNDFICGYEIYLINAETKTKINRDNGPYEISFGFSLNEVAALTLLISNGEKTKMNTFQLTKHQLDKLKTGERIHSVLDIPKTSFVYGYTVDIYE